MFLCQTKTNAPVHFRDSAALKFIMPMHLHYNDQSFISFINTILRQIYSEVKELEHSQPLS